MSNGVVLNLARQQTLSSLKLNEWRALIIALILAIGIASLMAVLGERIERTLIRQGSAIIGGDLILSSSRPINPEALTVANSMGVAATSVTQLGTMASHEEDFVLVSVRALSAPYPRGELELTPTQAVTLPQPNEAWAEAGVLERLNIKVGDQITLGNQQFTLTAELTSAPDRGRGFISFNPQIIINAQQLAQTGLLGPGARSQFRLLFAGDPTAITALKTQLQSQLQTGERLTDLNDQESQQNSALNKASSYLRLGALFALIIAAMTIFLSLRRFTHSQINRAALLKSLGLSNRQLLWLYLLQLGMAWALCSLIGLLITLGLESAGLYLLQGLIPQPVPNAPWVTYAVGPLLGLLIILCLGLPTLFRLQQSSPMQLFHAQPDDLSWRAKLPYAIALFLLLASTSWYLDNWLLTFSLTGLLLFLGSALGWFGAAIAGHLARLLGSVHPLGALLISRVQQQQRWYRIQIPVICLLFTLLSVNAIALNDLLSRWQAQLPENTPNHFLINIQEWEKQEVENLLTEAEVNNPLWPIYRGRLSKINGLPLAEALTPEQLEEPSLKRELNLTSYTEIPSHNELVAGAWLAEGGVSIEEEEAQELGLSLGDTVTFDIAGREVTATIGSFRKVRWDSFQPNFFFIFSPGILDDFSASYMTSFHLDEKQTQFSRQLLEQFPTLTLIDVRQVLSQLQNLLSKLSLLSGLLMLLTTAAGLVLLYVTLTQELEQRRYENALLQTLGASEQQCRQLDRLEMALIGGLSGLIAVILTELSLWPIHQQLLNLDVTLHPSLWLMLPLLGVVIFTLVSWISHRPQTLSGSYRTLASHTS